MTTDTPSDARGEDTILHVVMLMIGLIPVLIAGVTGARFGVEATLGGLMMVAGLWGLVSTRSRRA